MRQLRLTEEIVGYLRQKLGPDVNVQNYSVFESISLNTLPIRKNHFLFKGARHDRGILQQMANSVSSESIPLQIMHNSELLPIGRVFHGEVVDSPTGPELRTLFWVDNEFTETINLINSGTIDQVSVGMLPSSATCSECGFDYFSSEEDRFDNIISATCDQGHEVGRDSYLIISGLDTWFEMSLVGKGGAENARIVRRDQSVFSDSNVRALAASGIDPNLLVLNCSPERINEMDLKQIFDSVSEVKTSLSNIEERFNSDLAEKDETITGLEAKVADKESEIASLKAELEAKNTEIAEKDGKIEEITSEKAEVETLFSSIKDTANKILAASGDVEASAVKDAKTPDEVLGVILETTIGHKGDNGRGNDAASGRNMSVTLHSVDAFRSFRRG